MRRGRTARMLRALLAGALLLLAGALPSCRGRENGGAGQHLARPRVLPPGVLPWVGRVAIDWNRGGTPRERIVIGPGGLEMGPIEGPLVRYLFTDRRRADDLALFVRSYAPFTVKENGEELAFRGAGTAAAGPAERRMLVLWAHQVAAEAVEGRGGQAYGTVLTWHRSGDAGGECSELVVDLTGEVRAGPCGAASWTGRLADEQLRRLYAWFDAWGPFQGGTEEGQPGAPPVRVVFAGRGPASPSAGERTAVAAFAGSLFRELAARHPAPPPPASPKPAPAPGAPAGKPAPKPAPPPPSAPEPAGPRLLRPEIPAAHEPPPVVAPATPPPPPAPAPVPPPSGAPGDRQG